MNNRRREKLREAQTLLSTASNIVQNALDQEEDCFDNVPENLQDTDRTQKMEEAIESLEEAIEFISEDELIEITPENIRLRKSILDNGLRAKARNKK